MESHTQPNQNDPIYSMDMPMRHTAIWMNKGPQLDMFLSQAKEQSPGDQKDNQL